MEVELGFKQLGAARSAIQANVYDLARSVHLPKSEMERLHAGGLRFIPRATNPLTTMLDECLGDLERNGWVAAQCKAILFTHSLDLPTAGMYEASRLLRDRCPHLSVEPAFISGRPCSVIHAAIQLGVTLARELQRDESVLLIGADVAGTDEDRFFFGSAMGDAAVSMSIGHRPAVGTVLSVATSTHIVASRGVASHPDAIAKFRAENPLAIRAVISTALERAGLSWAGLDFIVPHTPYTQIWDAVSTIARYPRERILDRYVSVTGHLNSNDVIMHYMTALAEGEIAAGDIVALVSPGFGGSRGCTVVRR